MFSIKTDRIALQVLLRKMISITRNFMNFVSLATMHKIEMLQLHREVERERERETGKYKHRLHAYIYGELNKIINQQNKS